MATPEWDRPVDAADVHNLRLGASELAREATHALAAELRDLARRLDRHIQARAALRDLGRAPRSSDEVPAQAMADAGLNVFALGLFCDSYRAHASPPRLELTFHGCRVSIERWPMPADGSPNWEPPGA